MKALSLSQSLYQINKDEVRVNKVGKDIMVMRYWNGNDLAHKKFRNKVEYTSGKYLPIDSTDLAKSRVFSRSEVVAKGYNL